MPVKVLSQEYMNKIALLDADKVCITRSELNRGVYSFIEHYHHNQEDRGYGTQFMVKYSDFVDVVINPVIDPMHVNHISQYYIAEQDLALVFYHWFDDATKEWFLLSQCCEIDSVPDEAIPGGMHYKITQKGYWYELKNGGVTKLSSAPSLASNPYFTDMNYIDGDVLTNLDPTVHVKHLVFPWKNEIKQMYIDNTNLSNNVYLVFAGYSFYQTTGLPWPHGIVIFLNDDGKERLTNNSSVSIFSNKGADFATMCPPNSNCPYYILPDELNRY